jgi:tetratricopeptide (TPR) repeat protein
MSKDEAIKELYDRAKEAFRKRDFAGSRQLYEELLAKDPRHIPGHEGLAFVCFAMRDFAKAAELFQKVSRMDPRRAEPLINLGAAYNRLEEFGKAVQALRQALAKDRRSAEAYYNLGWAYRGQKQHGMAVSAYKEALRLDPEMVDAHCNLGNALLEMGNHSQAVLCFEKALSLAPDNPKARQGLKRSREIHDVAKKSISPFGRLVDVSKLEAGNIEVGHRYRELNPQERFQDRDTLHRLSKEAEQLASGLLSQLRDELEQALLHVSRVVSENRDTHEWYREAAELEQAVLRFGEVQRLLTDKTDEIRQHEAALEQH